MYRYEEDSNREMENLKGVWDFVLCYVKQICSDIEPDDFPSEITMPLYFLAFS